MTDQPLPLKPPCVCQNCSPGSDGCLIEKKIQEQAVQLKEYEKRFKDRGHAFQNAQNKSLLKIHEQAEVIRIAREALDNTVAVLVNYPELGHLNWLLNKLKEALDRVRGGK